MAEVISESMAKMFINGQWCDAASGDVEEIRNPFDGSLVETEIWPTLGPLIPPSANPLTTTSAPG